MYVVKVEAWNGTCYSCLGFCEYRTLKSARHAVALARAAYAEEPLEEGEGLDMRWQIETDDGVLVEEYTLERDANAEAQEAMDATWQDRGEFSTDWLGIRNTCWYTWRTNGGTKGAHDRTHGSGRWIERYEAPRRVDREAAIRWLEDHLGYTSRVAKGVVTRTERRYS